MILRPIDREDEQLVMPAFERLGDESRYGRFFTPINELSVADVAYLTEVDHPDHEAIVALHSTGEGLGVAPYVRATADPEVAEVAIAVIDDWQGRGLGRPLLLRLASRAGREGVGRFTALGQADNRGAVELLEGLVGSSAPATGAISSCA